jgi:hypothetical protein
VSGRVTARALARRANRADWSEEEVRLIMAERLHAGEGGTRQADQQERTPQGPPSPNRPGGRTAPSNSSTRTAARCSPARAWHTSKATSLAATTRPYWLSTERASIVTRQGLNRNCAMSCRESGRAIARGAGRIRANNAWCLGCLLRHPGADFPGVNAQARPRHADQPGGAQPIHLLRHPLESAPRHAHQPGAQPKVQVLRGSART